jgi:hypothetical protein
MPPRCCSIVEAGRHRARGNRGLCPERQDTAEPRSDRPPDSFIASVGHYKARQVPSHHRDPHIAGSGFGRRSARGRVRICVPAWIDGSGAGSATFAKLRDSGTPWAGGLEKSPRDQRIRGAGRQRPRSEVHPSCAQRSPTSIRTPVEGSRQRWPSRPPRLRLSRPTLGGGGRREGLTHGPGGRGARFSTPQSADSPRLEDAVLRVERRRQPAGVRSSHRSFRARPTSSCWKPARAMRPGIRTR